MESAGTEPDLDFSGENVSYTDTMTRYKLLKDIFADEDTRSPKVLMTSNCSDPDFDLDLDFSMTSRS
jgi:hypothetical protein